MQQAVNLAASRSYASSLTTSLNKEDVEEGVIYFNACVNLLLLGSVNTGYNRARFPGISHREQLLPLEGICSLLKMWSGGGSRPDNGGYVGFRTEGRKGKIVFPEYY